MLDVALSFSLGKYNLLKPKLLMGADLTNFSVQNHFLQAKALKPLKQACLYFFKRKKCFDLGFKITLKICRTKEGVNFSSKKEITKTSKSK